MNNSVVVIGSLNYDIIVKQARMPKKGETFFGDEVIQGAGGKGSNQAACCALLGLKTTMIGKVGNDLFGTFLKNELKNKGVNITHIKKEGCSGTGLVHIMPDGDYYSTVVKGANYNLNKSDIDECTDIIKSANYILFQEEIPSEIMIYTLEKIQGTSTKVILNNAPAKKIDKKTLQQIDYLIVNETEAEFMTNMPIQNFDDAEKAGKQLLYYTQATIVITLGEKGSFAIDDRSIYKCLPQKANAIDATGAGDSYIGAFVYGLSQNMSIDKCMDFASHVSALTVTKYGGQSSFPTLDEVNKVYKL